MNWPFHRKPKAAKPKRGLMTVELERVTTKEDITVICEFELQETTENHYRVKIVNVSGCASVSLCAIQRLVPHWVPKSHPGLTWIDSPDPNPLEKLGYPC